MWQPPLSTGGFDIQMSRYEISVSKLNIISEIMLYDYNGYETSATIDGLHNGSKYNVSINAFNCLGKAEEATPPMTVTISKYRYSSVL